MKRAAFALSFLFAVAAMAQDPAEYGRASAGTIEGMAKHSSGLSGSLSLSTSGSNNALGYGATLGGTIIPDKAWFFASALRAPSLTQSFGFSPVATPARAIDANAIAQLGDRQNLAASFSDTRTPDEMFSSSVPRNFLSLHYTGIISPNAFFTASVSHTK